MGYIKFDTNQLVNLEYSLHREILRTNQAGAYASTTIINCNTRKYHGLLVVPQPQFGPDNHVLLSSMDETIIQREAEFNLGIHKYQGGIFHPRGHKYVSDLSMDPTPKVIYRVGGVVLSREKIFLHNEARLLIRYQLLEAKSPTTIRLKPFLAFRNVHFLTRANIAANKKYETIPNGIKIQMYPDYSWLMMQFSKNGEYTHVPDWYYNFEYIREKARGYEYLEDLYVPGFFEFPLKKGESLIFSAGLEPTPPQQLNSLFNKETAQHIPRNNFTNCLRNAAEQFLVKNGHSAELYAGFPWHGISGRDTLIALPGLTLTQNDQETFHKVLSSHIQSMRGPLFLHKQKGSKKVYHAADIPLLFFTTLQRYAQMTGSSDGIWEQYGPIMKKILEGYLSGTDFNIHMQSDGLIYAGAPNLPLTWMDARLNGNVLSPRTGLAVEINALWFNAIMWALYLAKKQNDQSFIAQWKTFPTKIKRAFINTFWDDEKGHLADYVNGQYKDWSVRPNMLFAAALPYNPLTTEQAQKVLDRVQQELLTSRGIRSLSPAHMQYRGQCTGDYNSRMAAIHQGTVYPWLLGLFSEGYLNIYGKQGLNFVNSLYKSFEGAMNEHGIASISELYDGDPPHWPSGTISQAWNVGELLRIHWIIQNFEKSNQ